MTTGTLSCDVVADKDLVVRYVAGGLREEQELGALEAHLLTCANCREEVRLALLVRAELGAPTLGAARSRASWFKRGSAWWMLGTAAAAAVLVLLIARPPYQPRSDGTVLRGGAEGIPQVATVTPAPGAEVTGSGLKFVWQASGKDAHYRLTVTNAPGDVVWSVATSDTARALPRTVRLQGGRYSWYVDALLPDGRSATSQVRSFTVAR